MCSSHICSLFAAESFVRAAFFLASVLWIKWDSVCFHQGCKRLLLLSSPPSSSCKKFLVFRKFFLFCSIYLAMVFRTQDAFDSIHKTPHETIDQIVYSSVKNKPKTCQPMEKKFFLCLHFTLCYSSVHFSSVVFSSLALFFPTVCLFVCQSNGVCVCIAIRCMKHYGARGGDTIKLMNQWNNKPAQSTPYH